MNTPKPSLLQVRDLAVAFETDEGDALAVDGISFDLPKGETLCLVGESGCGKSVTALSILRLIASPPGRLERGSIVFEGQDLALLSERELEDIRGDRIGMIFQEPMTALNPVFRIGDQIAEPLLRHRGLSRAAALQKAVDLLAEAGLPDPRLRVRDFPHQLSGGMRQRVMIAMAVACEPALVIADEPTTALDVSIQGQVLALLTRLTRDRGNSLLLITHDLGVVHDVADHVAVMYAGKIVEQAPVRRLFAKPRHPYTQGLMLSRPRLDPSTRHQRLHVIPGTVPGPLSRPSGCAFRDRCASAHERCYEAPPLFDLGAGSASRCWLAEQL